MTDGSGVDVDVDIDVDVDEEEDDDEDHIPGGDGVDGRELKSEAAHIHQVLVRGCGLQ